MNLNKLIKEKYTEVLTVAFFFLGFYSMGWFPDKIAGFDLSSYYIYAVISVTAIGIWVTHLFSEIKEDIKKDTYRKVKSKIKEKKEKEKKKENSEPTEEEKQKKYEELGDLE